MSGIGERLKAHWAAHGAIARPGASAEGLEAFEARRRVRLPDDMREYFRAADGMEDHERDKDDFAFWPLQRLIPATEGNWAGNFVGGDRFFLFAGYLLKCYGYAIHLPEDRPAGNRVVIIWGGELPPADLAGSFTEFAELYLRNSPRLHGLDRPVTPERRRELLAATPNPWGPFIHYANLVSDPGPRRAGPA